MEIEKRIFKWKDGSYDERYHKKDDIYYTHREDGPAVIGYNKDGSIRAEVYYINNVTLTKEEWCKKYGWKLLLKGTPMGEIFLT